MSDESVRKELARLSAENASLRAQLRVPAPEPVAEATGEGAAEPRARCVLLMPDPASQSVAQGPPLLGLARVAVTILAEHHPDIEWSAEHDFEQVPDGAVCYDLAEALSRMFDSARPPPRAFEVIVGEDRRRVLRRRVVVGEPESERYLAGCSRQIQDVNDLLAEGSAACDAAAMHHAGWALLAVDVILARVQLARAYFEAGRDEWEEELRTDRPEYDPRYVVDSGRPAGL